MTTERALQSAGGGASGPSWVAKTGAGTGPWKSGAATPDFGVLYFAKNDYNVYKSTNLLASVSALSYTFPNTISSIRCSSTGSTAGLTILGTGGMYRSTDSGANWSYMGPYINPDANPYVSMESINVSSSGQKMAALWKDFFSTGQIWTSADYGASWSRQYSAPNRAWIDMCGSSDLSILYAVGVASYGSTAVVLYKSTDSGASWTEISSAMSGYNYPGNIATSSNGSIVAIALNNYVSVSTNGGSSFTHYYTAQGYGRVSMSSDGSTIFLASDNGNTNLVSSDTGTTWVSQSGLPTNKYYPISLTSSDGKKLITGSRYPEPTYLYLRS